MGYSIEEMKEKLSSILAAENPGVTSDVLVDIQNNYSGTLLEMQTLTEKNAKLEKDNADLILANGKLFQAVGVQTEKETAQPDDVIKSVDELLEEMLSK